MLYAAAQLILPSGAVLHQQVVETDDGVVLSFYPFTCENHSMTFVREIHLFGSLPPAVCGYAPAVDGGLYACVRGVSGGWRVLE